MRAFVISLAGLFMSTAALAVVTVDSPQAPASGPIIWNDAPAPGTTSTAPDKNGIIWDSPAAPSTNAPPRTSMPPPGSGLGLSPKRDSIIWDTPGQAASNSPSGSPGAPKTLVPPPSTASAQAGGSCREFQTTIVIDGKTQPAHGTACRQADGSWRVTR